MKKKKIRFSAVILILMLLAAGVLGFALFKLHTEYIPQQKEAKYYADLRERFRIDPEDTPAPDGESPSEKKNIVETTSTGETVPRYDLNQLFAMNSDMTAWLTIPGTEIDYPVMYTPDDVEYYLHTGFDGYYSFSGCLFVGENCDIDSDVFVIYGHNMNNGTMFGSLDYYSDYDFWSRHPDVILDTKEGQRMYRVFAAFPTKVYQDGEKTDYKYYETVGDCTSEQFAALTEKIAARSVIDTGDLPAEKTQLAYLSTCAYHEDNGRFVVVMYRIL